MTSDRQEFFTTLAKFRFIDSFYVVEGSYYTFGVYRRYLESKWLLCFPGSSTKMSPTESLRFANLI